MQKMLEELVQIDAALTEHQKVITEMKTRKSEIMGLVAAELCNTKSKVKIPVEGTGKILIISRRIYKTFYPEVELKLSRAKKSFEEDTADRKRKLKDEQDYIKSVAIEEKRYTPDPRFYLKVEDNDNS